MMEEMTGSSGLKAYVNRCDELSDMANNGEPYDIYYQNQNQNLLIQQVEAVNLVYQLEQVELHAIRTTLLKSKNKSVYHRREAKIMQDRVHSIYSIIEICICFPEQLLLSSKVLPVEAVAVVGWL